MAKKLEGKVAVVTGSGRGIAREVALLMANEGAKVVVNDIFREHNGTAAADKMVEEIKKAGGVASANYDSVATMAGGENIIKTAIDNFGKIDILANIAGNFIRKTAVETTESDWDAIMAVHLKGAFSCAKAAMPYMIQQRSGRIINISSRGAFTGSQLAYSAAMAGVMGFSTVLARELAEYNITVNTIFPSALTQLFPSAASRSSLDFMPGSRTEKSPAFVAPMLVYLATDKAAKITGRLIYASGGDICLYTHPLRLSAANMLIRKPGKWTLDEIDEVVPTLLGVE